MNATDKLILEKMEACENRIKELLAAAEKEANSLKETTKPNIGDQAVLHSPLQPASPLQTASLVQAVSSRETALHLPRTIRGSPSAPRELPSVAIQSPLDEAMEALALTLSSPKEESPQKVSPRVEPVSLFSFL